MNRVALRNDSGSAIKAAGITPPHHPVTATIASLILANA